jgi:hypothetical protein
LFNKISKKNLDFIPTGFDSSLAFKGEREPELWDKDEESGESCTFRGQGLCGRDDGNPF